MNVASNGYTPQYEGLKTFIEIYNDKGFVVLGFPANTHGTEPGTEEDIKQFCTLNYVLHFQCHLKFQLEVVTKTHCSPRITSQPNEDFEVELMNLKNFN